MNIQCGFSPTPQNLPQNANAILFGKKPSRLRKYALAGAFSAALLGAGAVPAFANPASTQPDTVTVSAQPTASPAPERDDADNIEFDPQCILSLIESGQVEEADYNPTTQVLTLDMHHGKDVFTFIGLSSSEFLVANPLSTATNAAHNRLTLETVHAALEKQGIGMELDEPSSGGIGGKSIGLLSLAMIIPVFVREPLKKGLSGLGNLIGGKQARAALRDKSNLKLADVEMSDATRKKLQGYYDGLKDGSGPKHYILSGGKASEAAIGLGHTLEWPVYKFNVGNFMEVTETEKTRGLRRFLNKAIREAGDDKGGSLVVLEVSDINNPEELVMVRQIMNQLKRLKKGGEDKLHVVIAQEKNSTVPPFVNTLQAEKLEVQ